MQKTEQRNCLWFKSPSQSQLITHFFPHLKDVNVVKVFRLKLGFQAARGPRLYIAFVNWTLLVYIYIVRQTKVFVIIQLIYNTNLKEKPLNSVSITFTICLTIKPWTCCALQREEWKYIFVSGGKYEHVVRGWAPPPPPSI